MNKCQDEPCIDNDIIRSLVSHTHKQGSDISIDNCRGLTTVTKEIN